MKKSNLIFKNLVVPNFSFEKTTVKEEERKFVLEPQAFISKKNGQFNLNIKLEIKDPDNEYKLKILAIGLFEFQTDKDEELLSFVSINGPALVFPYIRSFIATTTAQTGFDTITLPTFNLSGYKKELVEKMFDLDQENE